MTNPNILSAMVGRDVAFVTLSNTVDLPIEARMLKIGTAGNLRILTLNGTDITIPVDAGEKTDFGVRRVFLTGTTATVAYAVL